MLTASDGQDTGDDAVAHSHSAGAGAVTMAGVLGMRGQIMPHFHFQD